MRNCREYGNSKIEHAKAYCTEITLTYQIRRLNDLFVAV